MVALRPLPYRTVARVLATFGFHAVRQRGSHVRFKHAEGRGTTVPNHSGEEVARGTLRAIIRDVGVDVDEFMRRV